MSEPIGYSWLARECGVESVQALPVISYTGTRREAHTENGIRTQQVIKRMSPEATTSAHLRFALKHEGVPLEFLSRLFRRISVADLAHWVNQEPSGGYARRAGFYYEWLTGNVLPFGGVKVGNYIDAINPDHYVTATKPVQNARWRINNNLAGTVDFCPQIRRTPAIRAIEAENLQALIIKLQQKYGSEILNRSAVWLTTKESRSSFKIENEGDKSDRIKRFAGAIETLTGTATDPLSSNFLSRLQQDILVNPISPIGFRKSPVFIGTQSLQHGEIVHYIAPPFDQITDMLAGLKQFHDNTDGISPAIRAAATSFAFVYIHPMVDGNGRISRFLVNDSLRRDGAVPPPVILPVSARILQSATNRMAYDTALDIFSTPLIRHYDGSIHFGKDAVCEDGIITNFEFTANEDALPAWRYIDLTRQTEYMGDVIIKTVKEDLVHEAGFFLELYETRERVKNIIEAPDTQIDRIIRSIQENGGKISQKLMKEIPSLSKPKIQREVEVAVMGGKNSTSIKLELSGSTTGSSDFNSLLNNT